jgi:hypothetical protein
MKQANHPKRIAKNVIQKGPLVKMKAILTNSLAFVVKKHITKTMMVNVQHVQLVQIARHTME